MLEKEEEKRFGGWESLKNERIAKKKKRRSSFCVAQRKKMQLFLKPEKKKHVKWQEAQSSASRSSMRKRYNDNRRDTGSITISTSWRRKQKATQRYITLSYQ